MRSAGRPAKISFFGHFGSLNSGNEATLTAVLARLRLLYPEAEFQCICTNPAAVIAREGIQATTITTGASRNRNTHPRWLRRLRYGLTELGQCARAFKKLRGTDVFVVPGTGLLTDAFGLDAWGPFSLFKWVLAAKLRRARIMFVSMGAGPFYSSLGQTFAKASLSLADYRSYRDQASRDTLCEIGFAAHRDPIYPDLVFGLPEALLPASTPDAASGRRVVGLGLMAYPGRYSAAEPRPETYTAYLESLAVFVAWLLDRGYDIRLLFGDGDGDLEVVDELKALVRARLGSLDESRIVAQAPYSQDVLDELAQTDVVVATRFHNVLLSLLLNKPVIAISFHHKCSSLMQQMHLADYCHDIHEIDAGKLIELFEKLEQNTEEVQQTILEGVRDARAALDDQFLLLSSQA
jgi:polysaccharide pyruvyl transferase WcaK-like protein